MTDIILLISGKRKCGKDYICQQLKSIFEDKCTILRLSALLKQCYAKNHNLDLNELMSDSIYKEKYRLDMINWSDEIRLQQPGYFCKAPVKSIWIVSDIRRHTDVTWFMETYSNKIKTIRISAELDTRIKRGWSLTAGVDDVMSECDLDNFENWDLKVNNNSKQDAAKVIGDVLNLVKTNIGDIDS